MSLTPNTSTTAYLTVDQYLNRYDCRLVAELVSDTGYQQTESELQTDPNLAAVILDACAIFESTMKQGGRYEPSDIQALLAYNGGNNVGANIVLRLISDIVTALLRQRRGMDQDESLFYKQSLTMMDDLRTGKLNLGFQEPDTQAGTIQIQELGPNDFYSERLLSNNAYFWGSLPDRRYYY